MLFKINIIDDEKNELGVEKLLTELDDKTILIKTTFYIITLSINNRRSRNR